MSKYHQRRLLLRLRGVRENGSGVYGGGGALRHLPAAATNSVSDLPARMALRQSEYVVMKPGTARGRSIGAPRARHGRLHWALGCRAEGGWVVVFAAGYSQRGQDDKFTGCARLANIT